MDHRPKLNVVTIIGNEDATPWPALNYEAQPKKQAAGNPNLRLSDVLTPEALSTSLKEERKRRRAPGVDGRTYPQLKQQMNDEHIEWLIRQVLNGKYFPKALKVVQKPKANGNGLRDICIPAILDRVIQRIVGRALTTSLDPSLSSHVFGYRPGKSIEGAVFMCASYFGMGHQALETDIQGFFDQVNRDRLMQMLNEISIDPMMHCLVRRALEARRVTSSGPTDSHPFLGIPQGSPLSPVLANLYLRRLDDFLIGHGVKFVRYADDLVLFHQTMKEAEMLDLIHDGLGRLGLKAKASKTRFVQPQKDNSLLFLGATVHATGSVSIQGDRALEWLAFQEFRKLISPENGNQPTLKDFFGGIQQLGRLGRQRLGYLPNLRFSPEAFKHVIESLLCEISRAANQSGQIKFTDQEEI